MKNSMRITVCLSVLIILGLVWAVSAVAESPDFGDNCGSAELVNVPSTTPGYLTKGDDDVFKLILGGPGVLTIYTTGGIDTKGTLYNSNCKKIVSHNDIKWPSNPNFQIVRSVEAGTYYVKVEGDNKKTQGAYTLIILFDGDVTYTITATAGSGGLVSPSGDQSVAKNGNLNIVISPTACYGISDVIVDGVSVGARSSYLFSKVTQDHTLEASFALQGPFAIAASADIGGQITPSGDVSIACGADKSFSIAADAGYEILDVVVDGSSRGAVSSFTFTDVGESHTIVAKFKESSQFTITTIAGNGGEISPEGPVVVAQGGSQAFAITPDAGYAVEEVFINSVSYGALSSYTFVNVQANQTIEATFKVDSSIPTADCLDISDTPLDTRFRSAPPNIMFVLDDSGSMDWEVMTPDNTGVFEDRYYYVFDDPGDNIYYPWSDYYILKDDNRKKWKSQWSGYNRVYYNPQVKYDPWPNLTDASVVAPFSHPMHTDAGDPKIVLGGIYFELSGKSSVILDNSDNQYSEGTGWQDGGFHTSAYNNDYRVSTISAEVKTARWLPNLPVGSYNVYARWVASASNSQSVTFNIHADGVSLTSQHVKDQTLDGATWMDIGTYNFTPDGYVELYLDAVEAGVKTAVADAIKFETDEIITISNAHYYTWNDANGNDALDSGETVYLVNFVDTNDDDLLDTRNWYEVHDNGDDIIQKEELSPISENAVPTAARPRSISSDLQNFANWYTYYRRRELSATAAVSGVIDQASRLQIGIYSINGLVNEPVRKIDVDGVDERDALLSKLYNMTLTAQGTPLRRGFLNVGKYFDKTDSGDTGGIGAAPWADATSGGKCQQAFVILMTDGYYNGSEPWSPAKNTDGDNGVPYADSWSNSLADIAMHFYERDLVADDDLEDLVTVNERDKANYQHLVTYGVGFGVTGTMNPVDYDFESTFPVWPNPGAGNKQKIDDLWHATVNGRGRFLTSNDSVELMNDLLMVFKDIEYFAGSASSVSVNGDELYTRYNDEVRLFQAKYYSETWHGDVLAYKVSKGTGEIESPAVWSAAKQMTLKSADNRLIGTSNGSGIGLPFRHSKITLGMQKMLDADGPTAENMLNYIRGDASNEMDNGGTFRSRTWRINDPYHPLNGQTLVSSKLGDVVHASPVFKNNVLYSGGNDGMLHAYDAATGEEIFAYIPYLVFENLRELTSPSYSHLYFVDLTPTVADVEVGGTSVMLVGGLGKGGKGYYALDISGVNPGDNLVPDSEKTLANMVMWEYPNVKTPAAEIADMGYSFSRVTIAKSHDQDDAKYIVMFGNGYSSTNESAVLIILDPSTGKLLKKIDTGATGCNGLSTPIAVDVDYDNVVDYVYAGDLKGNLWKFDLTDPDYHNWGVAFAESSLPMPLFSSPGQPITTRPDVMYHCSQDGYLVFFGTGKYLEESDLTDTSPQSVYAIWDFGDDADDSEYAGSWDTTLETLTNPNLLSGVSLQDQDIAEYIVDSKAVRVTTENQPDWTPTMLSGSGECGKFSGSSKCDRSSPGVQAEPTADVAWYVNLPGSGERIVSDLLVRDNKLLVISYIPEASMCGTSGRSWLMDYSACTGARLDPVQFDLDEDGVVDENDKVTINPGTGEQTVVPSGITFEGHLQPPAILIFNDDTEVLYMSSSKGKIERARQTSARIGVIYWRIFRP